MNDIPPTTPMAPDLLDAGSSTMKQRAASRDNPGERSMARTVGAFNALTGRDLSEEEGWMFMVCLKLARSMGGSLKIDDDYIDGAAYMALQGECALREQAVAEDIEADRAVEAYAGNQLSFAAGDRVKFRMKHEEAYRTGTVYGDVTQGPLSIRPDDRPTNPFHIDDPIEVHPLTS